MEMNLISLLEKEQKNRLQQWTALLEKFKKEGIIVNEKDFKINKGVVQLELKSDAIIIELGYDGLYRMEDGCDCNFTPLDGVVDIIIANREEDVEEDEE